MAKVNDTGKRSVVLSDGLWSHTVWVQQPSAADFGLVTWLILHLSFPTGNMGMILDT